VGHSLKSGSPGEEKSIGLEFNVMNKDILHKSAPNAFGINLPMKQNNVAKARFKKTKAVLKNE
jgi:hypothetical protein